MTAPTTAWLAEQYHSGRIDIPNAHHYLLSDNEHEALTHTFNTFAVDTSGERRIPKASLISHVQSHLPRTIPGSFAETVYRVFAYYSSIPFYRSPSSPPPDSLSLLDFQRALAWLLPDKQLNMSETGNMGRMRTPADGRRLLFQSLATCSIPPADGALHEATRRRYARDNAYDAQHAREFLGFDDEAIKEVLPDWCKTNRDDDGDEMYHDLLDLLHVLVPVNYPYGSPRDDLRPLATELKVDVVFHELAIVRAELKELVRGLLALQFESTEKSMEPEELQALDDPVESVLATFVCEDKDLAAAYPNAPDIVAWPSFDYALQNLPCLFDPLHRVLIDTLVGCESPNLYIKVKGLYGAPPELQPTEKTDEKLYVLSRSWMNAMPAITPDIVDWESLHTVLRWNPAPDSTGDNKPTPPSADAIWTHLRAQEFEKLEDIPPTIIIAFDGNDQSSGEHYKGGVMFGVDYDKAGQEHVYNLYIFRLLPSIRYLKIAKQQWKRTFGTEFTFSNPAAPSSFTFSVERMVIDIDLPPLQRQSIKIDALEIWNDSTLP